MNIKMILRTLGKIVLLEAMLMILPLLVSLIYKENNYLYFLLTIGILLVSGFLLCLIKPKKLTISARDGFILVGISWIVMSLFGCLPFFFSKEIPSFTNAFFETVSGFTTTGATILDNIEELSHSMLFWRSFTHWIGGMGILVFILAILPSYGGQNIFILRAESPGPQVGKLVSKVKLTARILYLIYFALTILEIIFLLFGKMPLFDAFTTSFATAGTGGFSILNSSIAGYNSAYIEIIVAIFMLLFGINFNLFYLILIGRAKEALKSEELRCYLLIILGSVIVITINLVLVLNNSLNIALRNSFFQVTSIISTTGFTTTDFGTWPMLSKTILFLLMFVGGCAGSTGGGLKVSRIMILFKTIKRDIQRMIHPNSVSNVTLEGVKVDDKVVHGVTYYFGLFMIIFAAVLLIISLDGFDLATNITSVASCLNNIGPCIGIDIGPTNSFNAFSNLSKITLSITMLIGRLEIFPILLLINPGTWKKN